MSREFPKVGDVVKRAPVTLFDRDKETNSRKALCGTVVYVHPKRRFYTVAFELPGGVVRESFKD